MVLARLARNHQDSWARRPHGRRQERRVVAAAFVGMAPDQVRVASTGGSKDPRPRLTRLLEGGNALDLLRAARSAYVLAYGWWPGDELDELKDRVAQIRRAWDLMLPPE
jgi:hypothetical protein